MSEILGFGSGAGEEGHTEQLQPGDTLEDRGLADILDEGYSPLERPRANHYGETAWEQAHRESLDLRLAEEEPEIWAADGDGPVDDSRRAGRIVADPDALGGVDNDTYADDAGIDGAAASAEEAAVHIVEQP